MDAPVTFDDLALRMLGAGTDLHAIVGDAVSHARALNTRRGYELRQEKFIRFCAQWGVQWLPAEPATILAFLAVTSGSIKAQCLPGYRLAIRALHVDQGLPDPTSTGAISKFMSGNTRLRGTKSDKKAALRSEDVVAMCAYHDVAGGFLSIRAKAMLLAAYGAALRSSEVVDIRREHLKIAPEGMILTIPQSKTDQEGVGASIPIARGRNLETCPVGAVQDWMDAIDTKLGSTAKEGWLFPALKPYPTGSDNIRVYPVPATEVAFRKSIKDAVRAIGLDPRSYSGHSCRSGHATTVARNGATLHDLMAQGRWASAKVAMSYIQIGRAFTDSTSNLLGL